MNRLVIIGNGFDLAHGLPTGYCDFINDYWRNVIKEINRNKIYKDNLFKADVTHMHYSTVLVNKWKEVKNYNNLFTFFNLYNDSYEGTTFSFQNEFFRILSNHSSSMNWVDVENEYYALLKECLKSNDNLAIIDLNKQFDQVKILLRDYLNKNIEEKFEFSNLENNEFSKIFNQTIYESSALPSLFVQFSGSTVKYFQNLFKETRANIANYDKKIAYKESIQVKNYFLSFNYTSTAYNYTKQIQSKPELNEIHGRIEDERNPINFGFGDEMDRNYQEIEEKNDNEYLRNIKSFQYLHNSNYKRFLDLIDGDKFQVYIMGHSCGLSDRTLLNTIFEHENCISIKIYYHEILDENGNYVKDNYTEITQNISRHFNKKKLMREKIVNRNLCYPLPQIRLPKKEVS